MARWPLNLLIPPSINFSQSRASNTIRSAMEVGPAKVRRRTTAGVRQVQFSLVLTTAELEYLTQFYEDTLEEAGEFQWFDFRYPAYARWGIDDALLWTPRFDDGPSMSYPEQDDGSRILQVTGEGWRSSPANLQFFASRLYRMTARVRTTAAPVDPARDVVNFGVEGVASDGVTLINTAGADSADAQHFVAAEGIELSTVAALNTWHEFDGYFSGHSGAPFGNASNPTNPSTLYTGVRYFRPVYNVNNDDGDGTMQIAELSVGVDARYRFLQPPTEAHAAKELWTVGISLEMLP